MKRVFSTRIRVRRGLALLCAAVFLMQMCPPAFAVRTLYTTDLINHRAKPSSSSALLQTIPRGAAVSFLDAGSGGYYKVSYNGKTGYALASYLVEDGGSEGGALTGRILYTTDLINHRAKPSSSSTLLQTIPRGAAVSFLDAGSGGYYRVSYNGKTGYALASYLVASGESGDILMHNTDDVNFRGEPSSSARLICLIPANSLLTYLGPGANGYYYMRYGDQTGYVLSSYLAYADASEGCESDWTEGSVSLGRAQWKKNGSGMKIRIKFTNESGYRPIKAFELRYYPVDVWGDSMLPTDYSYYYTTRKSVNAQDTVWSDYMGLDERKGVDRVYAYVSRVLYADGEELVPEKILNNWTISW